MFPYRQSSNLRVKFQYRKRYGLHAMVMGIPITRQTFGFNTASGMDCMQFIMFDFIFVVARFQYRKRYGLHAILSSRTLENSEPRNRFSSTEPSKRQVQRTQAIGQRLVCENVPRTRAKGEARLADVDRSALPFCIFPQTSGNFFVAKSGAKGVQSQLNQGNFCP